MHLSTISFYMGNYRVLGRVTGDYITFLGPGGLTIGETTQQAEGKLVQAAESLGAWGVIGLTYSLATYEQQGTGWVAVLVVGTAISTPNTARGIPVGGWTQDMLDQLQS